MHASSLENMQRCYERFVGRSALLRRESVRVVDVGGANVNGSYADVFSDPLFAYTAVDRAAGEGVDVVLDDPYRLPFADGSVDIVLSGQAFEHVEFFWKLFEEMVRVLHPEGLLFLIVPSGGPIHRYPVDCYRFYPDAMDALARYAGIPLVAGWADDRGPWNDVVGVFARAFEPQDGRRPPGNRYLQSAAPAPLGVRSTDPEAERTRGGAPGHELLARIHERLQPRGYLEIGVRTGASLALARCPAVGVDPEPAVEGLLAPEHRLYTMSSDVFFESEADAALERLPLDLILIDGMHRFEFALRDFLEAEKRALPTSLIAIDDIYPNHEVQARRDRASNVWTGDVWKLHDCLRRHRPDLLLMPLDTEPAGLLLVAGLDPQSRVLRDAYNPLVRSYVEQPFDLEVLRRPGAHRAGAPELEALLLHLRAERERVDPRRPELTRRLLEAFRT